MNDPKRATTPDVDEEPGHYGAGYGEQVPDDAPPQPAPKTDTDLAPPAPSPSVADVGENERPSASTALGDDGSAVVFTPDDVHARPPDHTPAENAPESEKASLIFERS